VTTSVHILILPSNPSKPLSLPINYTLLIRESDTAETHSQPTVTHYFVDSPLRGLQHFAAKYCQKQYSLRFVSNCYKECVTYLATAHDST